MPSEETNKRKYIDMSNYKENADFITKYLDDDEWKYELHDTGTVAVLTGGVGGFKGLYNSFRYLLIVGDDEVQNYTTFPASAKQKRPQIAEFITRANYGLKYGAFEMDWNDGEVRFHLTIPMSAILADSNHIPALMALPSQMLDRYSRGFTEVLMDLKTPEEAIKDCEG